MPPTPKEHKMRHASWMGAICALAVAALPAAADAKKPYKEATFKATLSGSQVSTYEEHRPNDKDDPCDASSDGYGDQTIKFDAGKTFKITFRTPPKGKPNLYFTAGRPFVFTDPFTLTMKATAERNADVTVHASDIGPNCGDNGGADPGYVPPAKDCGVRTGTIDAKLYFHDAVPEDELFVPLPPGTKEKNHLSLEGTNDRWAGGASELRSTYTNCPWPTTGNYADDIGRLWISPGKIPESRLFDKKRKKLVISGDNIVKLSSGNVTGQTIIAWNLRMKRVK
jgi:hypothetical protein